MSTLIIAEKPSVAGSIASSLGATKRMDGYFEGNGYYVSYAFGHLYTLADTKDYNPEMESWSLEHYPFIPGEFKYKPINDDGVKKQIKIIKDLASKSDIIINACDGDREGELIFAELKNSLNFNKPIKRLWITSHTPKDIEKGMSNLKESLVNLEKAGYCRQQIDFIIGINLTVVFSVKAGGAVTIKLGRVILATLKLIFDREVAIANFKSEPFYILKCQFSSGDESEFYTGTYINEDEESKFPDSKQLIEIQESIKDKPGTVIKKDSNKTNEYAPKLFSLTELQGHISSKYDNFSPDLVLKTMQSLYEKKHLTYPRTSSRHLNDTQVQEAKESLYAVMDLPWLTITDRKDIKFHTSNRVFDSSKVDSHPAIIPTYIIPDLNFLSQSEQIVYTEVVKRFIAQFMPAAVYDTVEIVTNIESYKFLTRGKVLVEDGWKVLYKSDKEDPQDSTQDERITAKNIKINDNVKLLDTEIKEGKTKAPAHYTEATLLKAMETCGKKVENEDEILKGYTIGTSATRADTLEKLFECDYVMKKGKNIQITELGMKVIHYFPAKKLLRTDFTGQIEKTLKDIENGQYDSDEFMSKMIAYVSKNVEEIKNSEIPIIQGKSNNVVGKCIKCGKDVIETSKAYTCEGTRNNECNFTLWKDDNFFKTFGKSLTLTIAKAFLKDRKAKVKGLKSTKKEGTFDAIISIKENVEKNRWEYDLAFDNSKSKKSEHKTLKFKKG